MIRGAWRWLRGEETIANRRAEPRVLARSGMAVIAFCRGERVATTVLNVSLGGIALHWDEPRVAPGALVQMHIDSYLMLPARVIAEGGGFIRLKYTKDVPDTDRQRLRADCLMGGWGLAK